MNPVTNEEEYKVAALVDWETAGWYPSHWEYSHIFPLLQWVDDWPEYVEKILDPLPLEAAMMRVVFNDLEFQYMFNFVGVFVFHLLNPST